MKCECIKKVYGKGAESGGGPENIRMPLRLDKKNVNQDYFQQIVTSLGIEDKLESLPGQLPGGQQQRVALCGDTMI